MATRLIIHLRRPYVFGIILAVAVLGGCGQKGPLFLPEDKIGQERMDEIERKKERRDKGEQPLTTGRLAPAAGIPSAG